MTAGRPISSSAARVPLLPFRRRLALDDHRRRIRLADPLEQLAEALAVLGHLDRLERRAQQRELVPFEHALARQLRRTG